MRTLPVSHTGTQGPYDRDSFGPTGSAHDLARTLSQILRSYPSPAESAGSTKVRKAAATNLFCAVAVELAPELEGV